jgi:hypothetical protein
MPSFLPAALLPLRTFARRIKRAVTPPGSGRLAASQSAGTLTAIEPPAALEAGSTPLWQFRIENKSAIAGPRPGRSPSVSNVAGRRSPANRSAKP